MMGAPQMPTAQSDGSLLTSGTGGAPPAADVPDADGLLRPAD